jgi:tRNA nucleotidyltransferase/poly(A) polymerase
MTTDQNIRLALNRFSFLSQAAVVGGAVRDAVLGRQSDDIDLATSDRPEAVMRKCRERDIRVFETGIDHGTVTARVRGKEYEITTFRRDVSCDGRNATVEFADSISEDLRRRDFTINAMAITSKMAVVDPFDGMEDLVDERIRAVGDPSTRFHEDFLRIIRALRFASRFGFEIGDAEKEAMRELAPRVTENVAVERITAEIWKAFKDDNPKRFLEGLQELGILGDVIGAEFTPGPAFAEIQALSRAEDRMAWLASEIDADTGLGMDAVQRRLRLSNDIHDAVEDVHYAFSTVFAPRQPTSAARRTMQARVQNFERFCRFVEDALDIDTTFTDPVDFPLEPIVTGQAFVDREHEPGPQIGDMVEAAYEYQLEQGVTDPETLIQHAEDTVL